MLTHYSFRGMTWMERWTAGRTPASSVFSFFFSLLSSHSDLLHCFDWNSYAGSASRFSSVWSIRRLKTSHISGILCEWLSFPSSCGQNLTEQIRIISHEPSALMWRYSAFTDFDCWPSSLTLLSVIWRMRDIRGGDPSLQRSFRVVASSPVKQLCCQYLYAVCILKSSAEWKE